MTTLITASRVKELHQLGFLPKHFGSYMLKVESYVHQYLRKQCTDYRESPLDFYELSNYGAYLAPRLKQECLFCTYPNGYQGHLSLDAAGIVATIYTLNHLAFYSNSEPLALKYRLLLDYVPYHQSAFKICAAIHSIKH